MSESMRLDISATRVKSYKFLQCILLYDNEYAVDCRLLETKIHEYFEMFVRFLDRKDDKLSRLLKIWFITWRSS